MKSIFQSVTWGVSLIFLLVFAAAGPAVAQNCIPPSDNLVSWWPGDGNAKDIVDGNDGTLAGGATFGTGMVGRAFQFDGIDDYVEVPDSQNLDISAAITIQAWVYINDFPPGPFPRYNMQVLQKGGTVYPHAYALVVLGEQGAYLGSGPPQPRKFGLELTLDGQWSGYMIGGTWSNTQLQENTWYHLAATYNGNQVKLYLNGHLDASYTITGSIESTDFPVRIGNWGVGNADYFNGLIDEVQIFNRALSDTEIAAIYNAGSAGNCKASAFACQGFEPPMDNGPVTVKKNKALPLQATLLNGSVPITSLDIVAPPVVQLLYNSAIGDAVDVTRDAVRRATKGNQFEFDGTRWHFNLRARNYTAPGTYTVSMVSGDATDYIVDPTCTAQFVIK